MSEAGYLIKLKLNQGKGINEILINYKAELNGYPLTLNLKREENNEKFPYLLDEQSSKASRIALVLRITPHGRRMRGAQ
jgi:hypothetical protein